ncbi:MAG TPA: flippase [Solirubrobacteraceae bacterium]|jgi:O-antigen/teichoic acid export membrane protein
MAGEETVVRGAWLAFAAKLVGGVFTAALTIFLARRLGAGEYGLLALALSIVALVELPSDFGVAVALPRFVAEQRDRPELVRELTADAIRLETLGSLLFAAALAALAGPIADAYGAHALSGPLRWLALALVGQNFLALFTGVFAAMRRQSLVLVANAFESFSELTASVALVLLAGGVAAAAAGRTLGYALGGVCALALAYRLLGRGMLPSLGAGTLGHARRIAAYAGTLWLIDSAYTVFLQIDALLIAAYTSTASVAFFSAPMRLTGVLQYPGYAIASAVAPRLAGGAPLNGDAFNRSVRLVSALMVPAAVLTTVWATPIVHVTLGAGYGKAAEVLRALGPYVLLCGAGALVSLSLNYLGHARRRLPIALATLAVNVLLDAILIPDIGVTGAAVGTDAAFAIYVLAQLALCLRIIGSPMKEQLLTLGRCVIAAAPMAAILFAFGTGRLPVLTMIAGGFAATVAYLATLLITGELRR